MRTLLYFLISSDNRNLVHHTATGFVVRTLQASNFVVRVVRYYLIIARILKLFGLKRLLQFCCWAYAFSASFRSKTWTGVANQRRGRNPGIHERGCQRGTSKLGNQTKCHIHDYPSLLHTLKLRPKLMYGLDIRDAFGVNRVGTISAPIKPLIVSFSSGIFH